MAMSIPVTPGLMLAAFGNSAQKASYFTGVMSLVSGLVQSISNPLFGQLSDIRGRKLVVLISLSAAVFDYLLLSTFPAEVWAFVVVHVVSCLSYLLFSMTRTMIADLTQSASPSEVAGQFGLLGAVGGASLAVGPALGGLIAKLFGPVVTLRVCAAIVAWMLVISITSFIPETADFAENASGPTRVTATDLNPLPSVRRLFAHGRLKWLALSLAMTNLAEGGLRAIFFLYCAERFGWDTPETGAFFSFLGVTLVVSEGFAPKYMVRWFGERKTILIGVFFEAFHFVIFAMASKGWMMYLAVLVGVPRFVSSPTLRSVIARQAKPEEQGALQGALQSLSTIIQPIAPLIASVLFGLFSDPKSAMYFPGVAMLAMGAIASVAIVFAKFAFDFEDATLGETLSDQD